MPLARAWDGGPVVSVDGMRFVVLVPRHHLDMLGRYSFQLPEPSGGLRPLRDPDSGEEVDSGSGDSHRQACSGGDVQACSGGDVRTGHRLVESRES